jgi:hypothetical protein
MASDSERKIVFELQMLVGEFQASAHFGEKITHFEMMSLHA